MLMVPKEFASCLTIVAPSCTTRVWPPVQGLLVGAILAPGKRTVTVALRVRGLAHVQACQSYHRVLHRAVWSRPEGSRLRLPLRMPPLAPTGPVVMGLDDTLERRLGAKIRAQGLDRDPLRSSPSPVVKASGWRWFSLILWVPLPWAKRVWAVAFLPVLAPAERDHQERGPRQTQLTAGARPMRLRVRRWVPERSLMRVTDSRFAVITLWWRLSQWAQPSCRITRLRLAAALYEPAPPRQPRLNGQRLPTLAQVLVGPDTPWATAPVRGWYSARAQVVPLVSSTAVWYHSGLPALTSRWVLGRDPQEEFDPQALLCTTLPADPIQILAWFVLRGRLEGTWQEARAYLGMETPRH
jgi:hypothetical protein